jgi:hypothetical protein
VAKCDNCQTEQGPFVSAKVPGLRVCRPGTREVVEHEQTFKVPDVRPCLNRRAALDRQRYPVAI